MSTDSYKRMIQKRKRCILVLLKKIKHNEELYNNKILKFSRWIRRDEIIKEKINVFIDEIIYYKSLIEKDKQWRIEHNYKKYQN